MQILAAPFFGVTGSYESIATTTVGAGGTNSITFSSIPSTYKHLQVRFSGNTSNGGNVFMQLNGDTGTNYTLHYITGNGAGAYSGNVLPSGGNDKIWLFGAYVGCTTQPTVGVADILDYTSTNKNTTVRCLSGNDANGTGEVMLASGVWLNTAAVTSVTVFRNTSATFSQYFTCALYGIRG